MPEIPQVERFKFKRMISRNDGEPVPGLAESVALLIGGTRLPFSIPDHFQVYSRGKEILSGKIQICSIFPIDGPSTHHCQIYKIVEGAEGELMGFPERRGRHFAEIGIKYDQIRVFPRLQRSDFIFHKEVVCGIGCPVTNAGLDVYGFVGAPIVVAFVIQAQRSDSKTVCRVDGTGSPIGTERNPHPRFFKGSPRHQALEAFMTETVFNHCVAVEMLRLHGGDHSV